MHRGSIVSFLLQKWDQQQQFKWKWSVKWLKMTLTIHMALFNSVTCFFFYIDTSLFFIFHINKPWMEEVTESQSSQFIKHTVQFWQSGFDGQPELMRHLRECVWTRWTGLISRWSRVLLLVPVWRWWPDHIQLLLLDPPPLALPFTPQWPRCLSDAWARSQGAVSLCECAKPTPAEDKKKKKGMNLVLNVSAQMQEDDGRTKDLIFVAFKLLIFCLWLLTNYWNIISKASLQ